MIEMLANKIKHSDRQGYADLLLYYYYTLKNMVLEQFYIEIASKFDKLLKINGN